ncbi:L-ascorbate metabolism protein UlaG, beta-lactamase superfamily [Mucilaginibacter lappiensis]|uniref:L-ascorbate metabolism protein UlaG (Beta-lactamase superfamily) n=1 Tax=Mucilaginibacter lappiensis TaxID=354630 RepID=A0ABR6PUC1_9SPHI|nr:MBL fold metallo-hydrolase [Mucilaginibacter lappiensis]MBB6112605.1 L-ascorbate metabolism protein UlaG (beta-lactamase superfamily) [Mucilaginibacter lappiensis]SIS05078.1 L-ascorbate metabolism protein UlaG, beta-lactamase superfamily [Mucilaginibacter lappiensis]
MEINNDDVVFIKPNLAIEPLIDNWYAWPHLVSPATAAMNIKDRHLKIMNSYVQNPTIHAAAIKSPKMLGGPFIDYGGKRVDEIKGLISNTLEKCAELLGLRDDIIQLNEMLKKEAKGYALTDLYPKVPERLQGLVELIYDVNNNASFRFFESLLYATEYYDESLQSFNLFLVKDDDSRSFVLSTPKLPNDEILRVSLPFKSEKIDELFDMAVIPRKFSEIKDIFNTEPGKEELFKSFFTTEPPRQYKKYDGDGILTRYFGHACILTETKHTTILADPLISYGYETDISRFSYEDLPEKIDYVLITHNHQDHILFETLLRIRKRITNIVVPRSNGGGLQDPNLKLMFQQLGFKNIIELGEMETLEFEDCSITGLPFIGEHCDLDVRSKLCHHVKFNDGLKMLFAADSCNVSPRLYERIHGVTGDIDVIFLGMECEGAPLTWLYGPLMPETLARDKDESRRLAGCNFEQSKALIDVFNPRNVFVYAMGMEPWLKYISSIKYTDESKPIVESNKLIEYCRSKNIEPERLYGEKIIEYKLEPALN